jgi:hypothetical protein
VIIQAENGVYTANWKDYDVVKDKFLLHYVINQVLQSKKNRQVDYCNTTNLLNNDQIAVN